MKALRKQVYTPYSSIRGTNPQNQTTFKERFPWSFNYECRLFGFIYSRSFGCYTPPYKTYRLTSGFDPDNSLGGGQPTYWDQLATVYSRYRVNGAKITATFSKSSTITANEGPYICGIECSDSTSLPTTNAGVLISLLTLHFVLLVKKMAASRLLQLILLTTHIQISRMAFKLAWVLIQLSIGTQTFCIASRSWRRETNQCYCYHRVQCYTQWCHRRCRRLVV